MAGCGKRSWPRCSAPSWRPEGCGTVVAKGPDGAPDVSGLCAHHLSEATSADEGVAAAAGAEVLAAADESGAGDEAASPSGVRVADLRVRLREDVSDERVYELIRDSLIEALEAHRSYRFRCRSCGDEQPGVLPDLSVRVTTITKLLDSVVPRLAESRADSSFEARVRQRRRELEERLEALPRRSACAHGGDGSRRGGNDLEAHAGRLHAG